MNARLHVVEPLAGCGFLSVEEIDAWVEGTLDAGHREALERHAIEGCRACALLAADLEAFTGVVAGGLLSGERDGYERAAPEAREAIRRKLELASRRATIGGGRRWQLAVALAAAAALALVAWPLLRQEPGTIALPGGGTVSVRPPAFSAPPEVRDRRRTVELWTRAELAWGQGRWARARAELEQIVELDPQDHDAVMYLGMALLSEGRPAEATGRLRRAVALADQQGLGGTMDAYYLGLAELGAGSPERAREALARAAAGGGPWAGRAAELLGELGPS